MNKSSVQLDREIAEALVEARMRPPRDAAKADILRVKFTRALGSALARWQHALFVAVRRTNSGYIFESSDSSVIRALWRALTSLYYHPSRSAPGGLRRAAGTQLAKLRPVLAASWPEALAEEDYATKSV